MLGSGGDQLRLGREVLEEGALGDAGAAADLGRRQARLARVDQALDGGVEQAATRRRAALLLGPGVHHLMHHVDWDDPPESK